jgi:hypothetical protein
MKSNALQRLADGARLASGQPFVVVGGRFVCGDWCCGGGLLPKPQRQWAAQNHDAAVLRQQMAQAPVEMQPQQPLWHPGLAFQSVLGQVSELESYVGTLLICRKPWRCQR